MNYKDYMIILSPPENINQQVKKYRQSSARLIGDFEGMHGKGHITLKTLTRQKPFWTKPLFAQLEKELSLIEPITLQTNGFATFLPTDYTTIYAAIKSTPGMEDWFKRVRKCLNEKKAVPHITIARQIPSELAKKLWPKFKDRPWQEEFNIDHLTILQRETYGYDKKWTPFKQIPFRGDPALNVLMDKKKEKVVNKVDAQQISLFGQPGPAPSKSPPVGETSPMHGPTSLVDEETLSNSEVKVSPTGGDLEGAPFPSLMQYP